MIRLRFLTAVLTILAAACGSSGPSAPTPGGPGGNTAVTSIAINGSAQFDLIGVARPLEALAWRADGSFTVVTAAVSWLSSNPLVVNVSPAGVATSVDVGTSTISASYQGFSSTLPMRVGARIDCSSYLPTNLFVLDEGDYFSVVEPFGTGLILYQAYATASDAAAGLAVFQRYRNYCHVGRDTTRTPRLDYVFSYWLNQFGLVTTIPNEDCEPYDKATVLVVDRGTPGWAVTASGRDLLVADTAADATTMASMIRAYSNQCYIGRGNTRPNPGMFIHEYWK